jgi:hypothetical protein
MSTTRTQAFRLACVLCSTLATATAAAQQPPPQDTRVEVEMPALQQALLREEMVQHMGSLFEILQDLADGNLAAAADVADKNMGLRSMGKHAGRTGGMGPGRFMPEGMRAIALAMHRSASEFAEVARKGDRAAAYQALQPVVGACVGCHAAYRLK